MNRLLLLHGAIGAKDQLISLSESLKDSFEIYNLNFSGHGGRDFVNEFNIKQFANELINFLDENQIHQIDIFGYSMGGYVALYAAKYFPKRIGKVVTLGTKFNWDKKIAEKETKMLNPTIIEQKIPAFANVLEKRHQPNDWKELLARTADMMIQMGENNPLKIDDYKNINHFVKIGLADTDEMVSLKETKEVYEALPNAEFYTLADSNHPIEKANLAQLAEEIKTFLK